MQSYTKWLRQQERELRRVPQMNDILPESVRLEIGRVYSIDGTVTIFHERGWDLDELTQKAG